MSNKSFNFQAVPMEQWDTILYSGFAPAGKLIEVTKVDDYNPNLSPTDKRQGYQRPPERSRITRIGSYLLKGNGSKKILFPTAVLLASRTPLVYDKLQGTVQISDSEPLHIVDGQHRLAGLEYVIKEKEGKEYENFPVPFVIMEAPELLTEMTQFRVVNGTAKSVRTDLVNMILTATYADSPRVEIPEKDQWRIVVSNAVDKLAKDPKSPWLNSINLPGEPKARRGEPKKFVRATSIITSLRPVYIWLKTTIMEHQCRTLDEEIEFFLPIVLNYWCAVNEVVPEAFVEPENYVIQKTPGLFSLHKLLRHLLYNMYMGRREFSKENFVEFLSASPEITDPDFWHVNSSRASIYGSMKGFEELYQLISEPYRS